MLLKKIFYTSTAVLGVITLGIAGFASFLGSDIFAESSPLTQEVPTTVPVSNDGAVILSVLNEMNNIKLESEIFMNPMFLSLKDFTVNLIEEPKGRPNPFAPITGNPEGVMVPETTVQTASFMSTSSAPSLFPVSSGGR